MLFMSVCFDFCSTNMGSSVIKISRSKTLFYIPYCYQFLNHYPLITYLSLKNSWSQLRLLGVQSVVTCFFYSLRGQHIVVAPLRWPSIFEKLTGKKMNHICSTSAVCWRCGLLLSSGKTIREVTCNLTCPTFDLTTPCCGNIGCGVLISYVQN